MLDRLELKNFVLIDSLDIKLSPGLNILSGETGAGKSIVVDALSLLRGNRLKSSVIKEETESALVQAIFKDGSSAARRIMPNGRSTARIDGELVKLTELLEQVGSKINIFGQHNSQNLTDIKTQQQLIDKYLPNNAKELLKNYKSDYKSYLKTLKQLEELHLQIRERAKQIDILEFQINEIETAKLDIDELKNIEAELLRLRNSERINQSLVNAVNLLSELQPSTISLIAESHKSLEVIKQFDKRIESLGLELKDSLDNIEAISQELENILEGINAEPKRLEDLENRMAQIDGLKRKYGDSVKDILNYYDSTKDELKQLLNAEETLDKLNRKKLVLEGSLNQKANELYDFRQITAKDLSTRVSLEIKQLAMPNAVFEVKVINKNILGKTGKDEIVFNFSANLGVKPAALANIASGGELSRVMLALNIISTNDAEILVFDEVDSGIGGQTAINVAILLKKLARKHQVLVVTHLAQVAAYADCHFLVEKSEDKSKTSISLKKLDRLEQIQELARMLSGNISKASLENAKELLEQAKL